MKMIKHGEHLIQLAMFPRIFPVNSYLVLEADGVTLIDAGLPWNVGAYRTIIDGLGQPLVRIILTHTHIDHVGSLDGLHDLYPDAAVLLSQRETRFLSGERDLDPPEQVGKLHGGFPMRRTRPTALIQPGDKVESLEVIASPGHSPDHLAFFDGRDGTMIAGDAFQTRGGIAVSGTIRPIFPFPALATWHKATALASARVLRAREPSRLAVGHGPVLDNPLAAMDQAITVAASEVGE